MKVARRSVLRTGFALAASACAMPAQASTGPRVLRFAWWGGGARHEATLKVIRRFESMHPGLRVKAEYMGFNGYLERLTTQIAGRAEPDVMQINWAWLAMFSKRGTGFADLSPHADGSRWKPRIAASDLATGMVHGKLNAVPVGFAARVLLWNKGTFQRAGLPLPTDWASLLRSGSALRSSLGANHYALDGELYDMMLLSHAWVLQKHGMQYVNPANHTVGYTESLAQEWVETYQRLVAQQVCTPLPLRASLGGAEKPTEQQPDWVAGRWAGNFTWDSAIALRSSTLKEGNALQLGEFPRLPEAKNSGMFARPSLMYAVGRNSKQADIAAELVGYLTTDPTAIETFGRTRGMPGALGAVEMLKSRGLLSPIELAAHAQISAQRQAGAIASPSALFEHSRFQKFMREVFERVAYQKLSSADAAHHLVHQGNALLQRIK